MQSGALKKTLLALAMCAIVAGCIEVAFRIAFSLRVGASVLWFGTPFGTDKIQALTAEGAEETASSLDVHTVRLHTRRLAGYSKYMPKQHRVDHDPESGRSFDVGINRHGFRGSEFELVKAPGVTRVITLGASSTFGYHNEDSTTYPVFLEQLLNDRCGAATYEVINLGIPHLRSEQILALFLSEGLPLAPDVVTFYEGVNDSAFRPKDPVVSRLRRFLVSAAFADNMLRARREYTARDVAEHGSGKSEVFLANLSRMLAESRKSDALFVLATQQSKSEIIARERMRGVSYDDEVELVRRKLARGAISNEEMVFLVHSELMSEAQRWAAENAVPMAEVIAAMDERRDALLSWVHLNPTGNRIVADTLAGVILERTCVDQDEQSPAELVATTGNRAVEPVSGGSGS